MSPIIDFGSLLDSLRTILVIFKRWHSIRKDLCFCFKWRKSWIMGVLAIVYIHASSQSWMPALQLDPAEKFFEQLCLVKIEKILLAKHSRWVIFKKIEKKKKFFFAITASNNGVWQWTVVHEWTTQGPIHNPDTTVVQGRLLGTHKTSPFANWKTNLKIFYNLGPKTGPRNWFNYEKYRYFI